MATFISSNYGSAGAKAAKKFKMGDGKIELRRVVAASGNEELDIVHDIASAAKALKKDQAGEKVVALVLHGNDEGLSRIYRNDYLENMLNDAQLRDVGVYRMDVALGMVGNADAAEMSEALEEAAKALADAEVDVLELQACNVGRIEGMATFSFAGRLEALLKTADHTITIRTHTRYVSSGVHSKTKKVMVWLGADPKLTDKKNRAPLALTQSFPPFVDTK